MFDKVLIANRGAIAVRIERTLKKMGIGSVAVYSKADQDSLHVERADEAVYIGDGTAKETYLDTKKIIKAALDTGAKAIHPGYGFLSENTDFAKECEENGIKFIGPDSEQIKLFGLKHSARALAEKADVPLLPGTGLLSGVEEAVTEAEKIGYPVILKSTAGGGGIGMRICNSTEELRQAYDAVCHLAAANFNDAGVFLEKYVTTIDTNIPSVYGRNKESALLLVTKSLTPNTIVAILIGKYNIKLNLNAVSLFKSLLIPPTNVEPLLLIPGNNAIT